MKTSWDAITNILKSDGVAIIPTDTLYGIVARATSKSAVERIYKIKGREKGKPCIMLITSFDDLEKFGVKMKLRDGTDWQPFLSQIWPDKVSIVLPCANPAFRYLHRGTKSIAFRMIGKKSKNLFVLINEVGPLVAPSANPSGLAPARTVAEAKEYFKETVDIYEDGGTRDFAPSTLVSLLGSVPKILRQGAVVIPAYRNVR